MQNQQAADIKAGVVAVLSQGGQRTHGTGFVVSEAGLIATCAHVLESVLGAAPEDGQTVKIQFAANGMLAEARVNERWYRDKAAEDIAILSLADSLPGAVTALPLAASAGAIGHRIRSFGFPKYDFDGLGAVGQVIEKVSQNGISRLQLESSQITNGYSGGPIWDEALGAVIGQVTYGIQGDKMGRHASTAFATPSETLIDLCQPLQSLLTKPTLVKPDPVQLRHELTNKFNLEEIRTLCQDIGVDYDELGGEGKISKARELVLYMERRGRLSDLVRGISDSLSY